MIELLSDRLWAELKVRFPAHKRLRAAISYVTATHLEFGSDDVLVCDASDRAIGGGMTSATVLRDAVRRGAEVYSYEGLHSKTAIIDEYALIGSANLSANASINTCEASILTDEVRTVAIVHSFIEAIRKDALPVKERFLQHILGLEVTSRPYEGRRVKRPVKIGASRTWIVAVHPLSERISRAEAEFEEEGETEAEEHLKSDAYEVRSIRWSGKSRFRSEAKPGDIVIETLTEKRGTRKFIRVAPPCPILHRQDTDAWTRFYLEVPVESPSYRWSEVKAAFEALGVDNLTPKSCRELKKHELGILQWFEAEGHGA